MGLFLTLIFILATYLGPETVWGLTLVQYRVQLILACLATIASLPGLQRSRLFAIPQTYALVGMCIAVFLSALMTGWLGSIPIALFTFLPNAFTFFLVVLNCRTRRHLQLVVAVIVAACIFTIVRGQLALSSGNVLSPYLIGQSSDEGEAIYRLRGLSFINDPNDLSQLLVSLLPCLFFFWRKGGTLRNLLLVAAPAAILVYGMFLTHSRGGMVALLAVLLFAFRKKIGTVPAAILAGGLFIAGSAIGWSGGRDVSVGAGSDRLEAWSEGLQLIKTHPLFGVGFQRFGEYFYITAHNTIVVCAAELGMFGLFWWVMFVLPTLRDASTGSSGTEATTAEDDKPANWNFTPSHVEHVREAEPVRETTPVRELRWLPAGHPTDAMVATTGTRGGEPNTAAFDQESIDRLSNTPLYLDSKPTKEQLDPDEIRRLAALMLLCLVGYFTAGWFLSRAYVMTLFIYGGMVEVIYSMALEQDLVPPRLKTAKLLQCSAIWSIVLIIVVYVMLRIQHMLPH